MKIRYITRREFITAHAANTPFPDAVFGEVLKEKCRFPSAFLLYLKAQTYHGARSKYSMSESTPSVTCVKKSSFQGSCLPKFLSLGDFATFPLPLHAVQRRDVCGRFFTGINAWAQRAHFSKLKRKRKTAIFAEIKEFVSCMALYCHIIILVHQASRWVNGSLSRSALEFCVFVFLPQQSGCHKMISDSHQCPRR